MCLLRWVVILTPASRARAGLGDGYCEDGTCIEDGGLDYRPDYRPRYRPDYPALGCMAGLIVQIVLITNTESQCC